MAGLDTSIALGIKPVDFGDPNEGRLNALRAQMMQMQMQQGQFNMMKAQRDMEYQDQQRAAAAAAAARDQAAEKEAINAFLKTAQPGSPFNPNPNTPYAPDDASAEGSGAFPGWNNAQPPDMNATIQQLVNAGKFDAAKKMMGQNQAFNVNTESNLKVKEGENKVSKADLDRGAQALKYHASLLPAVTPETWGAWRTNMVKDLKGLDGIVPETPPTDPVQFEQLKRSLQAQASDSLNDHYEKTDQGLYAVNKATGRAAPVPGGENITPADKSKGPKTQALTDDRGNVRVINLETGEQVGPTIEGAGKQGGTFAKAQASRANAIRDMDAAIPELKALIEPNSILDRSTGSGAGALADSAMAFFGRSTEGAQAAAALKPIADRFLKMVPRFEGPQSDKDVVSYKSAAADLANEKLPVATRRVAAKTLLRLTEARRGQFGYSDEEAVPELYSPNQSGSGQTPQSGPYAPGTRVPAGGNPYASKSDAEIKAALGIKD